MQENFILTKLDKSDSLSVFLAYHGSLSCVCGIGLDQDSTSQQKFDRYVQLENGLISAQEYLSKAEKYIETIETYQKHPENFVDLSHHPNQISYKNIESLTDNFSNFIEDLYKSYDNFFLFYIDTLLSFVDKGKAYKAYLENKPKSKSIPTETLVKKEKFYSLLKDVDKEVFDASYVELTNLYYDLNEKRNAINHFGKTKSDLIHGHYRITVSENKKEISISSFPTVNFYNQTLPLDEYSKYAFHKILYSLQHLYAACVNTVLQDKSAVGRMGICPQLYPIGLMDEELKSSLKKNGKIHSDKQSYVFGLLGENNEFINFSCSRPQDPEFIKRLSSA